MSNKFYCYICFGQTEEFLICDRCDEHYCDDCSYTFSLYYQFQGARCYHCAGHDRRTKLTKQIVRDNKISNILK